MTDLINGHKLLERWNIDIFKLYDYINKGLQPLNQTGKPISPPNVTYMLKVIPLIKADLRDLRRIEKNNKEAGEETFDIIEIITIRLREINRLEEKLNAIEDKTSWLDFKIPKDKILDEDYYSDYYKVLDDYFSIDDVEKTEKNNPNLLKDFSKKALKTFHENRTKKSKETIQQQKAMKGKYVTEIWLKLINNPTEKKVLEKLSKNKIADRIRDIAVNDLKNVETKTGVLVLKREIDDKGNIKYTGLKRDTVIDIMKKMNADKIQFNPFKNKTS